jgi:hypothetical protein
MVLVFSGLIKTLQFGSADTREPYRVIFYNLKPFMLPLVVTKFVSGIASSDSVVNVGDDFLLVIQLAVWWFVIRSDNDDDDRWGRRRRKAAGRVRALASGRLVAEPA